MSNKKTMSWGWIIFWILIFWPVGVFLLFKKLNSDKTATLKNSKTVYIISYVLIGMGIVSLIPAFTGDASLLTGSLLFCAGGVWVNIIARNMKKNGEKYKKYITLIVNQQITQIDNIATSVGVTYEMAKSDLEKMIEMGYFVGATIDNSSREIILAKSTANTENQELDLQTPDQTQTVTCKSCGANNKVMLGQNNECEYCGSPLE